MAADQQYTQELTEFRHDKDEYFRESPDSPIESGEQKSFTGLHYFPPDTDWIVTAKLEPLPDPAVVQLGTSDGQVRDFQRYALLHFTAGSQEGQLTAYRGIHQHGDHQHIEEDSLFIPFRDAQAGKETYGSGRYLDVELTPEDIADSTVELDFNQAYNPYCAYNDAYSCPLPPRENTLTIPVQAGEKVYHE